MPNYGSIFEYYLHQRNNSEDYLAQCRVHAEPEAVHQLRLCIKKLRAFNKLAVKLGLTTHFSQLQIAFHLKKMFRLAGQIRDIQVQIQLLGKYQEDTATDFPEFYKWLLIREAKRIAKLSAKKSKGGNKLYSNSDNDDLSNRFSRLSENTIQGCGLSLLDDLYSRAIDLSDGSISNDNMHLIRKIVKQIKYLLNMMQSSYPDFMYDRILIIELKEIDVTAGDWHDKLLRVDLLNRFLAGRHKPEIALVPEYQKFLDVCMAETESAYAETCQVVKRILLKPDA